MHQVTRPFAVPRRSDLTRHHRGRIESDMTTGFETTLTAWFAASARDLPWRRPGIGAWPVLVSEFMLQQTPVARVLPAYAAWLDRWPTVADLAMATPGDAVRQWGNLGYPRRAIRLHESAGIISDRYRGQVPESLTQLLELPGVGSYTAAAVASFAYGQRHPVLDTNVRRVLARALGGQEFPAATVSSAERALALSMLPPADGRRAASWSAAVMELGALICTSSRPACESCPLAGRCAWRMAGSPAGSRPRREKPYAGSDRQCRGRILAELRHATGPLPASALGRDWPLPEQRGRVLAGLIDDGLVVRIGDGLVGLPGDSSAARGGTTTP
jgi:A/G-specific adenine glycosylase